MSFSSIWQFDPCSPVTIFDGFNSHVMKDCLMGVLKSNSKAVASTPEQRPSPSGSAGCFQLLYGRRSTSPSSSLDPYVCYSGNIFDSIKESVFNGDHYQNKRAGLSTPQCFHVQSQHHPHMLVRERGVEVTPTLLGTTTVKVHFQMKSGSTALR